MKNPDVRESAPRYLCPYCKKPTRARRGRLIYHFDIGVFQNWCLGSDISLKEINGTGEA